MGNETWNNYSPQHRGAEKTAKKSYFKSHALVVWFELVVCQKFSSPQSATCVKGNRMILLHKMLETCKQSNAAFHLTFA